jgi:hypothetical protein
MGDSNQIEVPPSFAALYTARSGDRLTRPAQEVRERYEVCEDLAHMLAEQASAAQFKTGASEREVLEEMQAGLAGTQSPLPGPEAQWVVLRIAELLAWNVQSG